MSLENGSPLAKWLAALIEVVIAERDLDNETLLRQQPPDNEIAGRLERLHAAEDRAESLRKDMLAKYKISDGKRSKA